MPKRNPEPVNLLDLVPVREVEWEKKKDGTVFLKYPKFSNRILTAVLKKTGVDPMARLHLDDIGSYVWQMCDGNRRVLDIAESMKKEFGNRIDPVYERLGAFVKLLTHHRCITYKGIGL
jgi:hypothetical protein